MTQKDTQALQACDMRVRAEETVMAGEANPPRRLSPEQVQQVLHDLRVHQIELEMQNDELRRLQTELEVSRERYFDLYDLAPVGYCMLSEQGVILEANLTATKLIGVERTALVQQSLQSFILSEDQDIFYKARKTLLKTGTPQIFDLRLMKKEGAPFWACVEATLVQRPDTPPVCRAIISDITERKQTEAARHLLEALTESNRKLEQEIVERHAVEEAARQREQHKSELLEQSRQTQEQLRHLSRQVLTAQEEERKRISRELHDVVAQTLTGINVRLALLKTKAGLESKGLALDIDSTQQLVEKSLNIVHQFSRELRPPVLDDLGLIPALHAFTKSFSERTGIHIRLTAFAAVEKLDNAKRTVLYRIVQEALTNVDRHAHASRVEVSVLKLPRAVCLTIKDDGKSFQVERVLHAKKNKRLGLLGMRERVEMVGGSFSIESAPGAGTTIRAQIPAAIRAKKQISR